MGVKTWTLPFPDYWCMPEAFRYVLRLVGEVKMV